MPAPARGTHVQVTAALGWTRPPCTAASPTASQLLPPHPQLPALLHLLSSWPPVSVAGHQPGCLPRHPAGSPGSALPPVCHGLPGPAPLPPAPPPAPGVSRGLDLHRGGCGHVAGQVSGRKLIKNPHLKDPPLVELLWFGQRDPGLGEGLGDLLISSSPFSRYLLLRGTIASVG